MKFQALVHDQPFDLTLDAPAGASPDGLAFTNGALTVDGEPVEASFRRIGPGEVLLLLDGRSFPFTAESQPDGTVRLTHAGRSLSVRVKTERDLLLEAFGMEDAGAAVARELRAPMPGLVLSILVEPGQEVKEGEGLVVLEAMKMENELRASADVTIATVHVEPGQPVGKNDLLVSFAD